MALRRFGRLVAAPAIAVAVGAGACASGAGAPQTPAEWEARRAAMVERQLRGRDVTDDAVLEAMRRVPRHRFVPEAWQGSAYDDTSLPIGLGQTISQPYIVGWMTQALEIDPAAPPRVLEIGTGSGYQAAVLAELGCEVHSIEIVPELADRARATLAALSYADRVEVRTGDGYGGWPELAPFARIIVTAAPPELPQALVDQLAVGGRLVVPVGDAYQVMTVVEKTADGVTTRETFPVRFVPMVGGGS
jgi:protein-L-isoaspartate(D-aspartate) O-methyltransferase